MKVLMAGGGTAGHINPALAIASYIVEQNPDAEILFAGTPTGMEAELVKKAGFNFTPINVSGFKRNFAPKSIVHNIKTVTRLFTADIVAKKIIKDFDPDVVIGTGGYVSGPVVLAGTKSRAKTYIHEQNAFPGVTNKILAKKVDKVFIAVEEAKKLFDPSADCEVVGNPIRQDIIFKTKEDSRKKLGLDDKVCILSFGGSLGARMINTMASDLLEWNYGKDKINHIHGYGRLGKENFPVMLEDRGLSLEKLKSDKNIIVNEYIDDMATCLASADIVIARSGAITLSELQATGKASILVPSPYVSENHQYHNAMVLVNHNAAVLIEEENYNKEEFIKIVEELYNDKEKIKDLGKNASKLAILDTTKKIYDKIFG